MPQGANEEATEKKVQTQRHNLRTKAQKKWSQKFREQKNEMPQSQAEGADKELPMLLGRYGSPSLKPEQTIAPPPGLELSPDFEEVSTGCPSSTNSREGSDDGKTHNQSTLPSWLAPQTANPRSTRRNAIHAQGSDALAMFEGGAGSGKSRLEKLRSGGDNVLVGLRKGQRQHIGGASAAKDKSFAPQHYLPQYQYECLPYSPGIMPQSWAPCTVPLPSQSQVQLFYEPGHEHSGLSLGAPWPFMATVPNHGILATVPQDEISYLTPQKVAGLTEEFAEDAVGGDNASNDFLFEQLGTPMKVDLSSLKSKITNSKHQLA